MERILPVYPLFVKDPNFSIWSATENLNEKIPKLGTVKQNVSTAF